MIGEQFGNYRSLSLLGEGGMGAVYLAEHPGIGRRVAVKVLHKNYTRDEHLLARFLNEARAANAIRHPNIIEILDSGMLADGTPFLVMELLEGESLGTRLRQHGRAADRRRRSTSRTRPRRRWAPRTPRGSSTAISSPTTCSSSPIRTTPRRERIKVLDFGIAKLQQGSVADSVKTRTGTLMGTPIYMSPEQCRGTRAVDHRSDIYSLGVIFYEMLVGQPPFVSEGFGDLVNMHLNVPPASARSKRPEIPLAVDALVLKMLAKNPEDRYAEMSEVQAALKASGGSQFTVRVSSPDLGKTHAKGMPVTQTSPMHDTTFSTGTGERSSRWRRSRRRPRQDGSFIGRRRRGGDRGRRYSGGRAARRPKAGDEDRRGRRPAGQRPPPITPPPVAPVTPSIRWWRRPRRWRSSCAWRPCRPARRSSTTSTASCWA